jgi:hypothetical protein
MPTRIVREGLLTSEPVNSLSERAELFYRRLMSVADDYGRYFAHPSILRSHCFPVIVDRYSEKDVKQMLSECVAKGVIGIYGNGKYLIIHKFKQQTRSPSKFPEPVEGELLIKCEANDKPMCSLVVSGVVSGVEDVIGDKCLEVYSYYPLKVKKPSALKAIRRAIQKHGYDVVKQNTMEYAKARNGDTNFMPHPATWFNNECYNDLPETWVRKSYDVKPQPADPAI